MIRRGLALALLWALAAWVRLDGLASASALGDAARPWLVALGPFPWLHPHAPPYGWGLYLPYAAILHGAGSLWSATAALLWVHALAAPVAAALAWRLRPGWGAALAGLVIALDPGLVDTALSGAEGYLAPLWIGLAALALAGRRPGWSPVLLGLAVNNHPLALCAAPLLWGLDPRARGTWLGVFGGALIVAPQVVGWTAGAGLSGGAPLDAPLAWLVQGGWTGALVLVGLGVGLLRPATRSLTVRVWLSLGLLLLAGLSTGYLRDHHLRLLAIPAAAGLAALPDWGFALGLLLLRPPPSEGFTARPGTLGLESRVASALVDVDGPLVVDGAWISGGLAAEPGAVTLDLWLRGRPTDELRPSEKIAVIVSAERGALPTTVGRVALRGDRWLVMVADEDAVRDWSSALCRRARLGGAWDGLVALQPATRLEDTRGWWGCE